MYLEKIMGFYTNILFYFNKKNLNLNQFIISWLAFKNLTNIYNENKNYSR